MRIAFIALLASCSVALAQGATEPAVKKSEQGICHERGSATYQRTKHFEPFDSMEQCLASGGRVAKNAPAEDDDTGKLGAGGSSWLGAIGKKVAVIAGMLIVVGGAFLLSKRRAP